MIKAFHLFLLISLTCTVSSFSMTSSSNYQKAKTRQPTALSAMNRQAFLSTAFTALLAPTVASAIDDLSMPTESETTDETSYSSFQKAMEEKLRKKAELQKKAAKPLDYGESMKMERERQKELKGKSKEERRNALCEELGRGC